METTIGYDQGDRDRSQDLHNREEEGVVGDRAEMRSEVIIIDLREVARRRALTIEELDGRDTGDPLLEVGVYPRESDPDLTEGLPDPATEEEGGDQDEGDDSEGDESEPPIEDEHRARDEEEGEEITEDGHDP